MYIACNVLESYPSCRCYNNLRPERRLVLDSVSSFVSSVNSSLRAGTVCSYKFCVEFRLDVFKFLFSNKGTFPESGAGRLATNFDSLVDTVHTASPRRRSYSYYCEKDSIAVYTLSIPYGLLYKWHRDGSPSYADQVNKKVQGGIVKLKNSARIEQRMKEQACKVLAKLRGA